MSRRSFLLSPIALALNARAESKKEVLRSSPNAFAGRESLMQQPEPYLTSDSGVGGPNAFSMVDGLNLPWPSRTPWFDTTGVAGGPKPFASHAFAVRERHAFPVTALVRKLISAENRGFCTRPSGDFALNLAGRLADDPADRPVLMVKTSSGTIGPKCDFFTRYFPDPDQSLAIADCRKVVGLPSTALGIIHFDLTGITGDVIEATLSLTCIAIDTAKTARIDIYELNAPQIFEGNGGHEPVMGVSANYPRDEGLNTDPAILFVGNFKNVDDPGWHYGMRGHQANIGYDADVQSNFYEGKIESGGNFGQDVQVWLDGIVLDGLHGGKPKLPAWRELYMRMYIRLNADFFSSRVTSWKMPGIGLAHGIWMSLPRDGRYSLGGYWDTGSTSGRGPITDGFGTIHQDARARWVYDEGSVRGAIGKPVDPTATEHPYKDLMSLGNTPYHHGMTAYDGGYLGWPSVTLRREKWYCIEQYVKMNSIDMQRFSPLDQFGNYAWEAANPDGRIKAWVDGRLVVDSSGFKFARHPAVGLRGLDGNWYFGGRELSTSRQSYRWRDVVIATKYIGPRNFNTSRSPVSYPSWTPEPNELKVVTTANTFESQNPKIAKFSAEFHRIVDDFSGGVYNPYWGRLGCTVFHGGGHAATDDNSVVILDYDDLTFKRLSTPSVDTSPVDRITGEYPDGQPGAAHTYDCMVVTPPSQRAPGGMLITPMRMAIGYLGAVDSDFAHQMAFRLGQGRDKSAVWEKIGSTKLRPLTPGGCSAYDGKRNWIWYTNAASRPYIRYLDVATASKHEVNIDVPGARTGPDAMTMRYDQRRDLLIASAVTEDGLANLMWLKCTDAKAGWRVAETSLRLPVVRYAAAAPFDYVPALDTYVLLNNGDANAVYEFQIPNDPARRWQVTRRVFTGVRSMPFAYVSGKRWSFVPTANAFMWLPSAKGPLYAYRPFGT